MVKGIDVSYVQGAVDWEKVKADGVEFAFIRAGYGWDNDKQIDKWFAANVEGCERVGIPYGIYHYSYAKTAEDAAKEARFCLRLMDKVGAHPTLPVAYDLEEPFQLAYSAEKQLDMIDAFCGEIAKAGYHTMLYMSASPLNKLYAADRERLEQWPIWVAHYGVSQPSYKGSWDVWQYGAAGDVAGISGDSDMDWAQDSFLEIYPQEETAADIIGEIKALIEKLEQMV